MFTGKGTQERCRQAFLAGVTDFINKPFTLETLLCVLNRTPASERLAEAVGAARSDANPGWQHVKAAVQSIEQRFRELDLTRHAIAEDAHANADYLGRLFGMHLRCTPIDYLHEVRIAEAARLLEQTQLSIYEIARACGYHTGGELHEHFRRRHGRAPREYRALWT